MANTFNTYLLKLRQTPLSEQTEQTSRSALEGLLSEFAAAASGRVNVQHEPKRAADKGAPDFKIKRQGMILGYVETKPIGENLDKVLKSEQIARYRSLSQNIVLTDYLHFIWINKDGLQRETLCHATDLESPRFRPREEEAAGRAESQVAQRRLCEVHPFRPTQDGRGRGRRRRHHHEPLMARQSDVQGHAPIAHAQL